ncbi:hypothetical protein ABPG72_011946 [Tetrahymena utriculariae]
MDQLIPLINEIHNILHRTNLSNELKLPQIVVIGSQSSGKSSVLESIIGKDFLPRGKGIVTRRPIEIQLTNIASGEEYAEILDRKGEKVTDMEVLTKLIEDETEKVAGKQKGVSGVPLKIRFFSKNVVDLLLVDLPGITKNPVGDQPADIEQKLLEIVNPYIANPNSIILAISKGTDDLANSESLKLAREFDINGQRTIGVITQIDLQDFESENALNDIMNKTYPLKLGYVGVVMRGQNQLKTKKIQDQIVDEAAFFENHSLYRKVADKMGIPYLIKTLNLIFMNHIKKCLPKIRENIIRLVQIKEDEIRQYGDFTYLEDKTSKGYLLLNLISKFSNNFNDLIHGKYLKSNNDELIGGARINYIFNNIFKKCVLEVDPFDQLTDDDIRTAIKSSNGIRPSLFVPEGAFENLVKQQVSRLYSPSIQCSHLVYEELRRVINLINIPEIERFDNLSNKIFEVMEDVLSRCLLPTDQMIKNLIEIELGYINTNHPDFVGGMSLIQTQSDNMIVNEEKTIQKSNNGQQNQDKNKQNNVNSSKIEEESEESESFWSWLPFQKSNKQTEMLDSKLKMMNLKKKNEDLKSQNSLSETQSVQDQQRKRNYDINKELNLNYSITNFGMYIPRQNLPPVPNVIRVSEKPSKKEATQTDMIKSLIVSYFNVVKKNINDSIPKTIISFLVNRALNICERELVNSIYHEELFDNLLSENTYILQNREETKQQLKVLKQCMNVINDLDAKF